MRNLTMSVFLTSRVRLKICKGSVIPATSWWYSKANSILWRYVFQTKSPLDKNMTKNSVYLIPCSCGIEYNEETICFMRVGEILKSCCPGRDMETRHVRSYMEGKVISSFGVKYWGWRTRGNLDEWMKCSDLRQDRTGMIQTLLNTDKLSLVLARKKSWHT